MLSASFIGNNSLPARLFPLLTLFQKQKPRAGAQGFRILRPVGYFSRNPSWQLPQALATPPNAALTPASFFARAAAPSLAVSASSVSAAALNLAVSVNTSGLALLFSPLVLASKPSQGMRARFSRKVAFNATTSAL